MNKLIPTIPGTPRHHPARAGCLFGDAPHFSRGELDQEAVRQRALAAVEHTICDRTGVMIAREYAKAALAALTTAGLDIVERGEG